MASRSDVLDESSRTRIACISPGVRKSSLLSAISRIASPTVHRVPDSFLAVDVVACNDFVANLAEQEGSLRVSKPTRRKSPPWTRTPANRCPASPSCANDDKEIRLYALESPAATGRLAS